MSKSGIKGLSAFGNSNDNMPGRFYLLGQVASGNNWRGKSALSDIKAFNSLWGSEKPPIAASPAIFIPFCIDVEPDKIHEEIRVKICTFGYFIHRYRLPYYAEVGINLHNTDSKRYYIDRFDDLNLIANEVNNFIDLLNPK